MNINRREFLAASLAAPLLVRQNKRNILFFTKSSGFEHPVIKGARSYAEKILEELGAKSGFEVTTTKDGGVFTPETLAKYDVFLFYTTGDLTTPGKDGGRPMSPEGKAAFLEAIRKGKGFVGVHSASDTFHSGPDRFKSYRGKLDPYIEMIGGEFIRHGKQQKSNMISADREFPGARGDFELLEEWYSLKDFQKDLHVVLVQETKGMEGSEYKRPPFPATWARRHGQGRVFYTSMGHREDVWTNPVFQSILVGGLSWAAGDLKLECKPNLETAAPGYAEIPPAK